VTQALFSDGVVLRLVPYGDADQVATLFTRDHGRITALARGARRSKRRFGGALGQLVVSQFGLRPRSRGELWTLESATITDDFTALAADVAAFAHASYALELVRELSPAEVPEPALLDLVIDLHRALGGGASAAVLRAFELQLLDVLGSGPVLDACVSCGRADELDAGGAVFDPTRGGVVCARCAPSSRGPAVRPLPAGARAYLVAARGADAFGDARGLDDAARGEAGEVARHDHAAARDAMLGMLQHLLGRPLRTVEFIGKVQDAARRRDDPT
jgi:DNA repair protein RecO (recombination protein O)